MNHWVEVSVPAQFRLGVGGIADQCGWRVKMQGDRAFVCTEENYTKTKPKLFTSVRLVDAKNADDQRLYRRLDTWPSQDEIIPEEGMPDVVDDEIMRRVSAGRPEEWWAGLSLAFMSVPDAEVSRHVFDAYTTTIAPQMPESSLWLTEFKPELSWRLASIRALFGATEAPELLDREGEWLGFQAARGLMNSTMFGFGPFIDVALLVAAPWLVGISSARRGGMLTVMFGKPQSGRAEFVSNELLDQFKPTGVLSAATRHIRNAPTFTADDAERFLAWWVDRINALFGVVLDPARYLDKNGHYDPRMHLGMLLSVERLFASVQASLAYDRRDEFTRKLLLFDILDLLEGLRQKDTRTMCQHRFVAKELEQLAQFLPTPVAKLALPRCERAAAALATVADGFYLTERVESGGLRVKRDKNEGWELLSLDTAAADYLRVVRNSTHSFAKMAKQPRDVSLLASHDGELPAELSDLGFVHLLRLVANPEALTPWLNATKG